MKIRTGIYGGSFNPLHNGHIALAERLLQLALVDEVWLMVSPQNPLKRHDGLLDERLRLDMARKGVPAGGRIVVSDYEMHLPRPSYTQQTLHALAADYPEREFYLIIGADNWACFPRWRAHEELLARYHIIVYPRRGYPIDAATLPPGVSLVDMPLLDVSSTEVRRRVAARQPIDALVPAAVAPMAAQYYHKQTADDEEHDGGAAAWRAVVAAVMLVAGIVAEHCTPLGTMIEGSTWGIGTIIAAAWYVAAFLLVGLGVMREAVEHARRGDIFTEFTLMSAAAIGAFAIGERPEAVAVMLLYVVGEALQERAVSRARGNIASLAAFRPDSAVVVNGDERIETEPERVAIGTVIEVAPGCRVLIDGTLLSADTAFDTSALTGESEPRTAATGDEVLAGCVAVDSVARLRTLRPYGDSAAARILKMVEEAAARKAPTELFIRRFARTYTPLVFIAALLVCLVPFVVSLLQPDATYVFAQWLHRSLVFLVISCPCALVIGVPLAYFAGIGAASRGGILFKGGAALDALAAVDTVAFDKTGTLTTGEFVVDRVEGLTDDDLAAVASAELSSRHPAARAVVRYARERGIEPQTSDMRDIAGHGVSSGAWLIGAVRLLEKNDIAVPESVRRAEGTLVVVAHAGRYRGYIRLSDRLKDDASAAVAALPTDVHILSGDRSAAVAAVASRLGVTQAHGDLLPAAKAEHIAALQRDGHSVAFVGDGINDAPVLAQSDVGIAMGATGTDMAVETADIVLRDDKPSLVAQAIATARHTRLLVRQNVALAIGIKTAVMLLSLLGLANIWLAVVADTGAALLCVANAVRPMRPRDGLPSV